MVDIETLGKAADSTIFQIAAIAFDIRTGERYSQFNSIADIKKNKTMNVDGDTLKWWLNTDKELLTKLLNSGTQLSSEEVLEKFHNWINRHVTVVGRSNVYLWGNGILFDNKMIQYQMQEAGLEYPILYKNDRDVRTLLELASAKFGVSEREIKDMYEDDTLVEHDAIDDVIYQINLSVGCYRIIANN